VANLFDAWPVPGSVVEAGRRYQFEPWHALALGGGLLAIALLSRIRGPRPSFATAAEGFATPTDETLCDPTEKTGTRAFANYVMRNFGGFDLGIVRACDPAAGATAKPSGHHSGRAWDWGVAGANVDGLLDLLFEDDGELIRRAGITYIIYNGVIWNAWTRTWQPYTGKNPHTDHVHFSFSTPGALGQTSFYHALG
jgi:hypothetical protein